MCKLSICNVCVIFSQNRQSFSQLPGDTNASMIKESSARLTGKGRGREVKPATKNIDPSLVKERASSIQETYKVFCVRFVRLNGILFTRTR